MLFERMKSIRMKRTNGIYIARGSRYTTLNPFVEKSSAFNVDRLNFPRMFLPGVQKLWFEYSRAGRIGIARAISFITHLGVKCSILEGIDSIPMNTVLSLEPGCVHLVQNCSNFIPFTVQQTIKIRQCTEIRLDVTTD